MRNHAMLMALAAIVVGGAGGCSRGPSAQEQQMSQLRDGLTHVQADNDRFEQRLNAMELQNADDHALQPATPGRAHSDAVPVATPHNLRVVRLSPGESGGLGGAEQIEGSGATAGALSSDDPDDTTPRPSIRVQGSGGPARAGKSVRTFRGAGDRIEETLPPEDGARGAVVAPLGTPFGIRPSALDPDAKRSYDAALALVSAHHYPQALEAFAAFLVRWPDHPNADNATYWRGECYFAQGEYAPAAEQFEGVIARFPLGNKVSDSLLKLGISQQKLGNSQIAKTHFDRLLREFPHSEAARHIPSAQDEKSEKRPEEKK